MQVHLPFAGITLFRFYGYNLSLLVIGSTPGNIVLTCLVNGESRPLNPPVGLTAKRSAK